MMHYIGDVPPDGCTCRLINYSDSGGWYLKSRDPHCSYHGSGGGCAWCRGQESAKNCGCIDACDSPACEGVAS